MAVTADDDPLPYGGKEAESGIRVDNPDWITTYGMVIDHNMMWVYLNRAYGTNDFTAEPQFVDPDGGDFRLLPGSPGIDAGTVTGATADQNGTVRPYGAAFDTGAYEFHP